MCVCDVCVCVCALARAFTYLFAPSFTSFLSLVVYAWHVIILLPGQFLFQQTGHGQNFKISALVPFWSLLFSKTKSRIYVSSQSMTIIWCNHMVQKVCVRPSAQERVRGRCGEGRGDSLLSSVHFK
jgi:hypothetical protein